MILNDFVRFGNLETSYVYDRQPSPHRCMCFSENDLISYNLRSLAWTQGLGHAVLAGCWLGCRSSYRDLDGDRDLPPPPPLMRPGAPRILRKP